MHAYKEFIKSQYEAAAAAFAKNPGSNEWLALKIAMWAWQRVSQWADARAEDYVKAELKELAVGVKGDDDFGEVWPSTQSSIASAEFATPQGGLL
jgi:hypothetical protein